MSVKTPPGKVTEYGERYYITNEHNTLRLRVTEPEIGIFIHNFLDCFGKQSDVPDISSVRKAFQNIGVGVGGVHVIRISDLQRIVLLNTESNFNYFRIDIEIADSLSRCIDIFGSRFFYFNNGEKPWAGVRKEIDMNSQIITDALTCVYGPILDAIYIKTIQTGSPYPLRISVFAGIITCMAYILGCQNIGLPRMAIPYMRMLWLLQHGWIPLGIFGNTAIVIANI